MHDFHADKPTHSNFSNIFFFLKLMFKYSPILVIGECLTGILTRLPARVISVAGVKYIIDAVTAHKSPKKIVIAVVVIALVLIVSELLIQIYREFFADKEKEKMTAGLSKTMYEKAKSLDLSSYDDPDFYNNFILVIQASGDSVNNILNLVQRYVGEVVSLITIASIILVIDPVCLLIILGVTAIFTPVSKKIGSLQAQRQIENNRLHRKADYFARIFYFREYAKEVRMNDIQPLLIQRYNEAADDVIENQRKFVKKIDFIYFFQEFGVQILGFMFILPLYLGYCAIKTHTLSIGDFAATFNGAFSVATSFSFLTVTVSRMFSESSKLIEKYREFLKRDTKIKDGKKTAPLTEPRTIELKNVGFTYPGSDTPVLKNINMTIHPNEKIALVGYNGAGKTTLTNLLLRLYDVTQGEILIDGENIKDDTIKSHRARFSAVFQDFQLFSATLGENVALDTKVDRERAKKALSHSGFTKELKYGLDTALLREFDDNGAMMSGGEAQKVAVSRAFYKDCPYVILDEPSANLDPIAEYNLNQAMLDAAQNKTVIFISHRLSTTVNADKIYVMEKGEIVESGTHAELLKANGKYAKMFNLQAEKYRNA